jgi:hypothetical protein
LSSYGLSLSAVLSGTATAKAPATAHPAAATLSSAVRTAKPPSHTTPHPTVSHAVAAPRPAVTIKRPKGHSHHVGPSLAPNGDPPAFPGQSLGTPRNNFIGWVGFAFTTGAKALSVGQLGRWVVAGNTGAHALKLVDAATGLDVSGASATVNTSGAAAGQYLYATLANPVTLLAITAITC